ncbi:MAG: FecR domain-containing protein [Proteobacteria bacterium]|nr:FecR domain-containing protein [Pseudomonadota bacterium]
MTANTPPDAADLQRRSPFETATAWVTWLERHPDDDAARAACTAWRNQAVQHDEAYRRAERTWRALGEVAHHPVLAAWRESARTPRARRLPWAVAAAAAGVAVLIAGYGWLNGRTDSGSSARVQIAAPTGRDVREPSEYRTATTRLGERQHLVLDDGTAVTLNTASRVEVDYRGRYRRVHLLQGEALFQVAKNPNRPFVVTAGNRQVVALGTSFGIRLDGGAVQVTLLEGRVAVAPARAPVDMGATAPDSVVLKPGQQLRETDSERPAVLAVDAERALSWQDGWIAFDNDKLSDAVQELSRYTRDRIVFDDPRFAALRVSGTIRTGHLEDLIDAVAHVYPLAVERISPDTLRLVAKK